MTQRVPHLCQAVMLLLGGIMHGLCLFQLLHAKVPEHVHLEQRRAGFSAKSVVHNKTMMYLSQAIASMVILCMATAVPHQKGNC